MPGSGDRMSHEQEVRGVKIPADQARQAGLVGGLQQRSKLLQALCLVDAAIEMNVENTDGAGRTLKAMAIRFLFLKCRLNCFKFVTWAVAERMAAHDSETLGADAAYLIGRRERQRIPRRSARSLATLADPSA